MNRAFEDSDLMAQSQDLELRSRCDEKCEQGSGHRRREFGESGYFVHGSDLSRISRRTIRLSSGTNSPDRLKE